MRRIFFFCYLLLQSVMMSSVFGQKSDYHLFDNISLGTEASIIGCFLQDTQGMVWIGSNKGLFSYDGYSVQPHFAFGDASNTRIYCGTVAHNTYLYLGADNGLLVYNYRTDTYENARVKFPKDIRTLVLQDSVLWLGTLNGLYTYMPSTGKLSNVTAGLPHQTVYSIIRTSDNSIYIGTYNGCCRYVPGKKRFELISLPVSLGRNNQFVNSLLEDKKRRCIWIGTEGSLYKYDPIRKKAESIEGFHDNSVKSLALDGNGQLLVGTDNGFYVYCEGEELQHIVHDSRNIQSLANNIIWTIFPDKENNIWLGTDYGISMFRHNSVLRYIPISQITGTGEGNQFYCLLRDSKGFYWFGGTNGLIRFTNPAGGKQEVVWYKMGDKRHPLAHNRVRCIYEDREHQLWIATDGSISRYDYKSEKFIHYSIVDSTHRYNSNWAYNLFEDSGGRLWIATCLGGIFVVDKQKLMHATHSPYIADKLYSTHNGLSGMFISQITPDKSGNVWALLYNSPNSIEKINAAMGKVTPLNLDQFRGMGIPNFLLCDGQGFIWIGFPDRVIRVQPKNNNTRVFPLNAYNHNEVLSMIEANDKIWISATDGFWVIDQYSLQIRRLHLSNKRFTGLYFDKKNGMFYLGTADGFAVSTPEALLAKSVESPIYLTALYVNNQFWQPNPKRGEYSIRGMERIELTYDKNNLSFEFSDLPYSLEEKNKLVYRLGGIDRDWNVLSPGSNRINYNNLPYGTYRLAVGRLDDNGSPSAQFSFWEVTITPPWYYTLWAKLVYVLMGVAMIAWTVNFFRVKSRLHLVRMEKEKILEQSQMKIDFFANLSHDLKTPLSMIIAPVSKMLAEIRNREEKKQLELIQRNAMKLNSLIHKGLDFNRMDSDNNTLLIFSKIELVSFAKGIFSLYVEEKGKEKNLIFDFRSNKDKIYVSMDAIKLESILDNLLSNAVKYTPEGGNITLELEEQENSKDVDISVTDSGIGVSPQDQPYVFQRFFQSSKTAGKKEGTGIGLYLVKTYAELHGGRVSLFSRESEGTTILLTLPVRDSSPRLELSDDEQTINDEAPLVLIVDDNFEIAGFIKDILQGYYRCQLAENGKIGLEFCSKLHPDIIIADVMMPVMDGLEMIRRLKKQVLTATIPVILLTAKSDKETELESIRMHVDAFIPKPFEPDILLSRVEQLVSSSRKHEEKARMEVITQPKEIEAVSYDEKFLADITYLIEEHVSESELNVNALSEWSGVNTKQLYRKLKQLTGMTPVEYIKSIRMKKAAMLLKQRKFTVAEVMYMVGFSNHSYFSKCFQCEFGMTPKQYMAG